MFKKNNLIKILLPILFLLILNIFYLDSNFTNDKIFNSTEQIDRCLNFPDKLYRILSDGEEFNLKNGFAVKSTEFIQAYYVSALIEKSKIDKLNGEIITWLVWSDLSLPSYIEGVGKVAELYSIRANNSDNLGSIHHDGYTESIDCINK